jgi:hypothetical protein
MTTADDGEEEFSLPRAENPERFAREPDISTLANYPTSLLWFDTPETREG